MASYLGDFAEDATVHFMWSSNDSSGASIMRAVNGEVRVYKDNGVSQSTSGVTDTEDFDALTGVHVCTIDTSADAFYAVGADYTVVLSAATIDGQTVNAVLAHFSVENRFVDVNVTAINGTASSLTGGNLDVNVVAIANAAISAAAIATDAITSAKIASDAVTLDAVASDVRAQLVDQVWDEGITDHRTGGTVGALLGGLIIQETVIAVYTSQTSFTLSTGSAEDDAYNGCNIVIKDSTTSAQKAVGRVLDYTGSNKTITLEVDPLAGFTFSNNDLISILARNAPIKAEIQTEADASLASYDGPTDAEMNARTLVAASYFDPTADAVASVTLVATTTTNTDMVAEAPTTAQVNAEVDTALADINLDHLVGTATAIPAIVSGTYIDQMMDDGTASFDRTTDSLQVLRDRGDAAWATGGAGADPTVLQNTTITGLSSQTVFNLTAGSDDADAYNGCMVVVEDSTTATQKAVGVIVDYSGSPNRTVTLLNDPGIFTMANGDTIDVIADRSVKPVVDNRTLDVSASGEVSLLAATQTSIDAIETDTADIQPKIGTPATDVSADIAAVKAETALIIADTNELQSDDIPGAIVALNDPTVAAIADGVWDEILTGGTHNVATSAGRRLRQLEAGLIIHDGTAQAGSPGTITLDTGASASDDFYNHTRVLIIENTGIGQERIIVDYDGNTKIAKIAPPWVIDPANGSTFEIEPALAHAETGWATIKVGLAAAGTATTITLDSDASSVNEFYTDDLVKIDAGTGEDQIRVITGYVGSTRVATVHTAWLVNPDITSEYIIEDGHPYLPLINTDAAAILVDTADIQPKLGSPAVDISADIAAVKSETSLIVADTNELQGDDVPGLIAALNNISIADVNTQADLALSDINLDHLMKVAVLGTDVVDDSVLAKLVSASATADWDNFVNTTDSLQAQRDNVGSAVGGDISADVAAVKAETVLIVADTNELQTDDIPTLIAALNDISTADVNAQVLDVLVTDTFAQIGQEAPAATQSFLKMMQYLYKAWRNKSTQTATEYDLYNDDTTTVDQKATVSDDATTFSRLEVVVGS